MDLISFILFWSFEFYGGIAPVVEHLTADQEVPGFKSGCPLFELENLGIIKFLTSNQGRCYLILSNLMDLIYFLWYLAYGFVGGIAQW